MTLQSEVQSLPEAPLFFLAPPSLSRYLSVMKVSIEAGVIEFLNSEGVPVEVIPISAVIRAKKDDVLGPAIVVTLVHGASEDLVFEGEDERGAAYNKIVNFLMKG